MCEDCGDLSHLGPSSTRRAFLHQTRALGIAALLNPIVAGEARAQDDGEIPAVGYGKTDPGSPLAPVRFMRNALKADEVLVDILYCGVCHTDIHFARRPFDYLMVPGHESLDVFPASAFRSAVSRLAMPLGSAPSSTVAVFARTAAPASNNIVPTQALYRPLAEA